MPASPGWCADLFGVYMIAGRKISIEIDYFGEVLSVKEMALRTRCDPSTIRARLSKGLKGWDLIKPRAVKCSAQCIVCLKPFPIGSGKPKKYCSRQCQHKGMSNNLLSQCRLCGCDFKPRRDAGNGREQVYCSRKCAYSEQDRWNYRPETPPYSPLPEYSMVRQCQSCGKLHPKMSRKYCNDECRTLAQKLRVKIDKSSRKHQRCIECECLYTPIFRSGGKYCSTECGRKHSRRIGKARRRAAMKGCNYETVDPFKVFDRDGWKCQLCGTLTPRKHRGTYKRTAPELDHVVPLSKGGEHNYSNTQCLCRQCNSEKGNGSEAGQLGLFAA